ncbi:MAG: preprotein translocase subunit SecE [Endomicrobium sp.]|jgi:preprotein translocase subunit SecE|nr:preprotein translocase subunit SecE [Endomicrobium sp.]
MSLIKIFVQFFKSAYYELTKVTWLSKKEVVITTAVVIFFIVMVSVFVSVIDLLLGVVISAIL